MSSYDNLATTIDEVVDAAIESAMAHDGWLRDGDDYFRFDGGLMEIRVTGPSAGSVRFLSGEQGGLFIELEAARLERVAQLYSDWDSKVRDLFSDWGYLPNPTFMGGGVDETAAAVKKISLGEDLEGGSRVPANPQLADLGETNGHLEEFLGGTVSTFRRNYSRRLEVAILPNQCGLGCEILEAMIAEVAIFSEARKSVASTADAMLAGMKKARPAPATDGTADAIMTVLGIGAAVAGMFASGGGATFLTGIGIATRVSDKLKGTEKTVSVEASTPEDVYEKAQKALTTLDEDINTEETSADEKFKAVSTALSGGGDLYDLKPPGQLMESSTSQELIGRHDVLHIQASRLRTVGKVLLPNVAAEIQGAARGFEPYDARNSWYRAGGIGIASTGPSASYEKASNDLALVLANTAQELRQAARHLVIAAGYFDQTDEEVQAAFRSHEKDIRKEGAASLPYDAPTPPPRHHPGLQE